MGQRIMLATPTPNSLETSSILSIVMSRICKTFQRKSNEQVLKKSKDNTFYLL
ncbi:hypothetical protein [Holospora curviuscula]|uniref:hypothetical protein n=1 Tax=Holospora curviuscula TaxID=1082868 RepID=UPI001A9C94F1|nr:hypothetical protein [Holospora curviuscula]